MIWWTQAPGAEDVVSGFYPCARSATTESLLLRRLCRLVNLRELPILDAAQRRQVDHALYSTYWDCVRLGMQSQATTTLGLPRRRRHVAAH